MRTIGPAVKVVDPAIARGPRKETDPELRTAEHARWRETVLRRAGYRCEAVTNGKRCTKRAPEHRMFADHIVERKDGGALLDPWNGQCLCGAHHTAKTIAARNERRANDRPQG